MSASPNDFLGTVTAAFLGQWPGTDPVEAAKVSLGLFSAPHLPSLAALPARGGGSDAVGRTAALLQELPVDVQPYGWRFADRPGLDHRRAVSALSTDINVLADVAGAAGVVPDGVKAHITGPLSLAAAIHLHYGERALRDHGARRDIAQSLAAGLAVHAQKLQAAVPGSALTLQIDEPHVAAIVAGTIPTASGYRTLRSIPASELRQTWSALAEAAREAGFANVAINLGPAETGLGGTGGPGAGSPGTASGDLSDTASAEAAAWRKALEIALESGADAVAVPLNRLDTGHWELLAGAIEAGLGVWAGTVPASAGRVPPSYSVLEERIMRPWRGLGLDASLLNQLRITPESSLAGLSPQEARAVVSRALEVAERLSEIRYL
ncbi:hypothetical protein AAGW05_00460 [Arthrobacter sp. LAPM80]|uniref:hypothetical protein n=1 Tax=Arthrobacter sp. LAPM80 TaxID=3141788 RepID=UPI00398A6CD5